VDAAGNGEWGIALRCAQLAGNRARLFAGCGIVAGSDPATELAETGIKLRPMRTALEQTDLSIPVGSCALAAEREPPLRLFTASGHRAACHFPLREPEPGVTDAGARTRSA
jgi:hypothetical protein